MDLTHLHLLLNHFPIVGTAIAVALMLWGIISQSSSAKTNALFILIAMSLVAIPVFFTGEPAEETVEHLPGISKAIIHEHEESAELAIWILAAAGLASAVALWAMHKLTTSANKLFLLAFVLSALAFVAMARVGYYGGQIRHTELSSSGAGVSPNNSTENNNNGQGKDDDD